MKSETEVLERLRFWQGMLAGLQLGGSLSKEKVEEMKATVTGDIEAIIKEEIETLRRFLETEKNS